MCFWVAEECHKIPSSFCEFQIKRIEDESMISDPIVPNMIRKKVKNIFPLRVILFYFVLFCFFFSTRNFSEPKKGDLFRENKTPEGFYIFWV